MEHNLSRLEEQRHLVISDTHLCEGPPPYNTTTTSGTGTRTRLYLLYVIVALFIAFSISTVLVLNVHTGLHTTNTPDLSPASINSFPPPTSCGPNRASALAKNCTFDPLSFSWLPSPCVDATLTQSFLGLRPWVWYLTSDTSTPVPVAQVLDGEHAQLYVTQEYHMWHCTYMWRKLHRGMLGTEGRRVDGYIGNYAHTDHCESVLTRLAGVGVERLQDVSVVIRFKFPECGAIGKRMNGV